ncbi:MAG: hypothetical protein WEC34_05600 [Acidimicrobiia bacterium]
MSSLVPTVVWRATPAIVVALDERLGPPVDGYVNGTQTWLSDHGPGASTLEWRLHPVAGFRAPDGSGPYDLWDEVVGALAAGADHEALALGNERRAISSLWDGLECFPAYGDEIEPATLAMAATEALGIPPDAAGLVDHDRIGAAWEDSEGRVSLTQMLFDELADA